MTVPILSTARLTFSFTVSGKTHVVHAYVRSATLVGSDWYINSRTTDSNDTKAADAGTDFLTAYSYLMGSGTTTNIATIDTLSGGIWTTRSTLTTPFTGHTGGTSQLGWQGTFVFRDTSLHKVKVVSLEGNLGTLAHYTALASLPTAQQNFAKEFTSNYTLTHAPYLWMVGRGNQYLDPNSIVGVTFTRNRKTARGRGLT